MGHAYPASGAKMRARLRSWGLIALGAVSTACGSGDSERVEQTSREPTVLPDAIAPMTPEQYPRFYAELGPAAFERANARTAEAARAIARDRRCDALELIGVADRSTADQIHWYGDCTNGFRGRISEDELRR